MTTTNDTNSDPIPTIRSAHQFKEIFLPKFRAAFAAGLKEIGLELKGPKDVETRHAVKGALRAVMEIVADAGWGWSYASGDATSAVTNVFGYRSKTKAANTSYMTAGSAPEETADESEDEEEEEGDEDEEEEPE